MKAQRIINVIIRIISIIFRSDVADNLLIICCEYIQQIKGAVNRHFVNYFCFTLIRCADNLLYELGLSHLFILFSYYGHNCNYFRCSPKHFSNTNKLLKLIYEIIVYHKSNSNAQSCNSKLITLHC